MPSPFDANSATLRILQTLSQIALPSTQLSSQSQTNKVQVMRRALWVVGFTAAVA